VPLISLSICWSLENITASHQIPAHKISPHTQGISSCLRLLPHTHFSPLFNKLSPVRLQRIHILQTPFLSSPDRSISHTQFQSPRSLGLGLDSADISYLRFHFLPQERAHGGAAPWLAHTTSCHVPRIDLDTGGPPVPGSEFRWLRHRSHRVRSLISPAAIFALQCSGIWM
jgi:hypothetical protein